MQLAERDPSRILSIKPPNPEPQTPNPTVLRKTRIIGHGCQIRGVVPLWADTDKRVGKYGRLHLGVLIPHETEVPGHVGFVRLRQSIT